MIESAAIRNLFPDVRKAAEARLDAAGPRALRKSTEAKIAVLARIRWVRRAFVGAAFSELLPAKLIPAKLIQRMVRKERH